MIKTIICDIDGTLIRQEGNCYNQITSEPILIEGTIEKLFEWERKNYNIVLITGRKESTRRVTEKQLQELGIVYDHLIMGVGGGPRVLINDLKPGKNITMATSFNLERNSGIKNVDQ